MELLKPKRGRPLNAPKPQIKSDYMDVNEVAQFLKMSSSHIYTLTSRKEIPHMKVLGKKLLFDKSEILDWLRTKKVSAK